MKKLFLLVIAIIFAFSMNAQKIGVKAGYGMSGYTVNYYSPDGSALSTGFNAGLVAELDLEVIGLRADVTFNQLGNNYDSRNDSPEDFPFGDFYHVDYKQSINYLNIGVSVKKGFGPAYILLGPYFGYALAGNQTTTITPAVGDVQSWTHDIFSDPDETFDFTQAITDDNNPGGTGDLFNKVDFGVNLGLGASFAGVFVEANVGLGMANFYNVDSEYYAAKKASKVTIDDKTVPMTDDLSQKNIFFGLSVGYMFGF